MSATKLWHSLLIGFFVLLLAAPRAKAQGPAAAPSAPSAQVSTPADVFGFRPGADYTIAGYDQLLAYYHALDASSDRVRMTEIGTSVGGRPMKLLFISSAENLRQLDRWRAISAKLSRARIDETEARQLAKEGKAVVWIDAGMHSTEMAPGQMAPELAHRLATEESDEMQKIRDNVILLLMPMMNPDGLKIVKTWYDRHLDTPYETTRPPWLYHAYAGHDINRDGFMNNMPETRAVSKVLYNEWYPQIVYNHHQAAPDWARIFLPPFSDPVNPNIHPGVTTGVNQVGTAMAQRFMMKDMPGVVSNNGYTMFWNGGGRTTPYFHNQIGILTETAHATPTPRYYATDSMPDRIGGGISTDGTNIFHPDPWEGGPSHFRDAVEYAMTASLAVLDVAAQQRQQFLYNIYRMGRDAIEAGQSGTPYAYVIPPEQRNVGEAHHLVNLLQKGGVEIHRAMDAFAVGDTTYPAGSFVVYAAQAFRPYVVDLMEPQQYPTRRKYPGGPPDPPYDITGWTLPMQMDVTVDRVDAPFVAPTARVDSTVRPAPGRIDRTPAFGWALSHRSNASAKGVNRLLQRDARVHWAGADFTKAGTTHPAGTIVIERHGDVAAQVDSLAETLGLDFAGLDAPPDAPLHTLQTPRVGLYKSWKASKDEGWTRWLLERYDVPVDTLHDADIQHGDLSAYSAILLPHQRSSRALLHGHAPGTMPEAYVGGLGKQGAQALDAYVADGGTLIAFDGASDFAIDQLDLPVRNVTRGLPSRRFSIPGSLIRMNVDAAHPLAYGMPDQVAASFSQSRAFEATPDADRDAAVEVVTRYAEDDLLMSGWALGAKQYIGGKAALMRVRHGAGDVVLFGFRPQFRGQPRGTYKLIFNAIHGATLDDPLPPGEAPAAPLATDAKEE